MAIGQRRTGEMGGGEVRIVWVWVWWMEWFGFTIQHLSWMAYFSLFLLVMVVSLLSFPSPCVCHHYSIRSLRSCVCSPVCALSLSLYSFFGVSILPLFCSLNPVSYSLSLLLGASGTFVVFHLHRLLPDIVLSFYPPSRPRSQSHRILYIRV